MCVMYSKKAGVRLERIAVAYLNLATVFQEENQQDSALYYGSLAMQSKKNPDLTLQAASFLNEIYARKRQMDSAYKYLTITNQLKDSLYSNEKIKQLQNLQFNEKLRQQQLENARREALQRYQNMIKVYSLIAG